MSNSCLLMASKSNVKYSSYERQTGKPDLYIRKVPVKLNYDMVLNYIIASSKVSGGFYNSLLV